MPVHDDPLRRTRSTWQLRTWRAPSPPAPAEASAAATRSPSVAATSQGGSVANRSRPSSMGLLSSRGQLGHALVEHVDDVLEPAPLELLPAVEREPQQARDLVDGRALRELRRRAGRLGVG